MGSGLIVPRAQAPQPGEVFKVPDVEIPRHLQEDFAANPHLEPLFYTAVGQALTRSFNDPTTALREVTAESIKERIELCYRTVTVIRHELKLSLRKSLDLLPEKIAEALRTGKRPEDLFAADAQDKMWSRGDPQRVAVDPQSEDLTNEAAEADDGPAD